MIPLDKLPADRPFVVFGLGLSGRATAHALLRSGREVWAWDDSETARAVAADSGIPLVDPLSVDLGKAASLVLSPGIPHTFPQPHPVVIRARDSGLEIIGDIEILFRTQPDATYVGITGTNGKSTTTALIGHILEAAGREVRVGGNLGTPVLDFTPVGTTGIYVLEMSSYQLVLTPNLVFNVAVLINISPDHLGRHGGMEGYVAAKRRIFAAARPPAAAVIGVDDAYSSDIAVGVARAGAHRVMPISATRRVDGGAFVADGRLWDAIADDPVAVLEMGQAQALPGEHNGQNAAAAYAVTRALGVERETVVRAILDFPGLAHRQERIAGIAGVLYVNDSKATNADATIRALACYDRIYWIAGGRPKEDGLNGVEPWLGRVRHAILIGEAEAAFADFLAGKVPVTRTGTLDRAVAVARQLAEADGAPGAVVLLSPACASFDQFRSFEHRGDVFRTLVKGLAR